PADHPRGGPLEHAVQLLAAEADRVDSGSALVVDRLVDLLFVYALRAWLSRQRDTSARSWFGALQDPIVGPAVRAVHDNPAQAWTVEALAERSGLSRAPFPPPPPPPAASARPSASPRWPTSPAGA